MANDYSNYDDIELVNLLKVHEHKEAAFKELYRRHSQMVHSYCYGVIRDEDATEDIFQETFIKFFENADTVRENINIPGFLMKIARNLCLNYKRDKKNNVPIDAIDAYWQIEQNYEKKQLLDILNETLELLEDEYKEAFIMREYTGLNYHEIANICEISEQNARSRVFRAKNKIKTILQPYLKEIQEL